MGKYFGTDGVRGVANQELTPEFAFKLGRCGGYVLTQHIASGETPVALVGRDTRISGEMLESALVAGLLSVGIEVYRLGIISTPAVAYLTKKQGASCGIMISASHNPVLDNGIKFFGADGFKLVDELEDEIEKLIDAEVDELPRPSDKGLGTVHDFPEGRLKYREYLVKSVPESFNGIKVALDAANGSTAALVNQVFADLDAEFDVIGGKIDGLSINDGVGSTHPEALQVLVRECGSDVGLAFDGDGDRIIAVDENGDIVDGDKIMFIFAKHLKREGLLRDDTLVATVMSNLGFRKALAENGIKDVIVGVGDRYVVEEMRKSGYVLGGEQSGHLIYLGASTTGDGMYFGIQLVNIMRETGKKLSELAGEVTIYPQKLVNIRVNNADKDRAVEVPEIAKVIAEAEAEMAGDGRILVRASGTEPLLRVMAEAPTMDAVDYYCDKIADVVRATIGIE
ncbi:MAG: phosphoglucosamine mutase [Lactobacillales bacterium]|jgi:phosphoglucosamine mutase|nr:phosphoglucosamine mutase [Lactobacillales bacterium]